MTPWLNMFDVKTIDHDLVIERKITSGHSRCPKCAKSLTLCTRSTLYPRHSLNHMLGCFGMSQKPLKIFSTKMSQVTMQLSECSLSTSIKFATWGNFKSYTLLQNIAGLIHVHAFPILGLSSSWTNTCWTPSLASLASVQMSPSLFGLPFRFLTAFKRLSTRVGSVLLMVFVKPLWMHLASSLVHLPACCWEIFLPSDQPRAWTSCVPVDLDNVSTADHTSPDYSPHGGLLQQRAVNRVPEVKLTCMWHGYLDLRSFQDPTDRCFLERMTPQRIFCQGLISTSKLHVEHRLAKLQERTFSISQLIQMSFPLGGVIIHISPFSPKTTGIFNYYKPWFMMVNELTNTVPSCRVFQINTMNDINWLNHVQIPLSEL